ncbi:MAG TPA: thioesterase family protein [Phycisphaerae bacterium]|nr:thioesterase family protein [Phycisphaerae bacterium]
MPREFSIQRRVQFAETDMAGVMHFSNYFRWMEEVEHAYLRSVGMSVVHEQDGVEISWPRVHVSCEYFAPLYFEDEVEVRMEVTDIRDKSLTYEATFSKAGQRTARGRVKMVCCRWTDNRFESVAIPESVRARLES